MKYLVNWWYWGFFLELLDFLFCHDWNWMSVITTSLMCRKGFCHGKDEVMLVKVHVFCSPLPYCDDILCSELAHYCHHLLHKPKVHYSLLLCHRGWTDERLGQNNEGGVKRQSDDVEGGERDESSASQWEQSEISLSLTAMCVHSSLRLASYLHSILTIWVWSVRSKDSLEVMFFYLWNGCMWENVAGQYFQF